MGYEKDLVILVPDKNMQFLLEGLLSMATVLGIRKPSHQLDIHPLRDAGCLDAAELLESQTNRYAHAIVVSNSERSGRANIDRNELEARIEDDLQKSGWGERARAVVVAPGIGRWLLEHVYQGHWSTGTSVQQELEAALRRKKVPQSPDLYRALGVQLVDEGEPDLAWQKILSTFKSWFGVAAHCRLIARRYASPERGLPYGLRYEKTTFRADGKMRLGKAEHGLTCATFILAVLRSAGVELLSLADWPVRDGDKERHLELLDMLRNDPEVARDHVAAIATEVNGVRYRPEEVAGAASSAQFPVSFLFAEAAAEQIMTAFALGAGQLPQEADIAHAPSSGPDASSS